MSCKIKKVYLMRERIKSIFFIMLLAVMFTGCDITKPMDNKFGDQSFKTAIALIELHKIRNGSYPRMISDIQFAGDWDAIGTSNIEYKRIGDGYELNIVRGWLGQPSLSYPKEFWQGLGIISSNVEGLSK